MIRHFLVNTMRGLRRRVGYTMINLAGLTIGIFCVLLVLFYVRDELSFDRFHKQAGHIYRVNGVSMNPEGNFYRTILPPPLGPTLLETYPEVEQVIRIARLPVKLVGVGEQTRYESGFYLADPAFFDLFSFGLLRGDPETALEVPGAVILSENTARTYFGDADPMGQVIRIENSIDLTITGIIQMEGYNTYLNFDFLAPISTPGLSRRGWLETWNNSATETYILLHRDTTPDMLEAKLPDFVTRFMAGTLGFNEQYELSLQRLTDIHLYPHRAPEEVWAHSDLKYLYFFPLLGVFILAMACFNYMNLSTALAVERARETGVRKVLGAQRSQLIGQFLVEALGLALPAVFGALLLVRWALPAFGELIGKSFSPISFTDPVLITGVIAIWFITGLVSGAYPAFYLSAFRPSEVIHGVLPGRGKPGWLRNGLVVAQFVISISMIISVLVVGEQLRFMQNKDLGYDKEHLVIVPVHDVELLQEGTALKAALLQVPGVRTVTYSSGVPNDIGWHSTARWEGAGPTDRLEFNHVMVDHDFTTAYGLELVEGRSFSPEFSTDATAAYILNETGARAIGWDAPIGKKFTIWSREGEVVGIVKDFNYEPLSEPVKPIALHFGRRLYRRISVKLGSENISGALTGIESVMNDFMPDRPFEYRFLDEALGELYLQEERFGRMVEWGMLLSVFLACLGLLGLSSFIIERRAREISIRKILGASVPAIMWLILRRFVNLMVLAFGIAAPVTYLALSYWLQDFAYQIELRSSMFLLAGMSALILGLTAAGFQVGKAALAGPIKNLRSS